MRLASEPDLAALAFGLGARTVQGFSKGEETLIKGGTAAAADLAAALRAIGRREDPLGEAFCSLRTAEDRRPKGATYTPRSVVSAMVSWAAFHAKPARIVDPGVGSGRFLVAAGRRFPEARLVGVDVDPLATLMARGHLAAAGMAKRAEVHTADFREFLLPSYAGQTLFIGNPPYVRHHLIDQKWKRWLTATAAKNGLQASQLAGMHVHFFLATAEQAKAGDRAVFVTAAEWLDVNYGRLVRELFLERLGGMSVHLLEPTAVTFQDAATTSVISCFEVQERPRSIYLRRVEDASALGNLSGGRLVRRERLEAAHRWTPLLRPARKVPEGYVELGELCKVHRGQVTGLNRVWIAGEHAADLPEEVLFAAVTRARELLRTGEMLRDSAPLRRVIDLPIDLDGFDRPVLARIRKFLRYAKRAGADSGYIAAHRKAWWSVGLRKAAPILTTYMARRAPAFVRNLVGARHINIAHGIYPREEMSAAALDTLSRCLAESTTVAEGRTYAGGLTKFEPREMERLLVPAPDILEKGAQA